jgi:hypothetical protein
MKTNIHFWSNPAKLFLELETLQTKVVDKITKPILRSIFVPQNRALYEVM